VFVMIDRGDYWQCAYIIRKNGYEPLRAAGLDAFRQSIARIAPFLADRLGDLADWDQIKLLTVQVDRLTTWHRPGLLCIGDSAHAMSPVGGVGINLAIQDAVAAANLLYVPLRSRQVSDEDLARVQRRRAWPTRWTQRLQVFIHRQIIYRVVTSDRPTRPPWFVRLLLKLPLTQRIPARIVGLGFRPEHVHTPEVHRPG
jgi:2-polyprenyl-6-methoxyphenol hydroxylase-like FAD-dependent oxidoreductase